MTLGLFDGITETVGSTLGRSEEVLGALEIDGTSLSERLGGLLGEEL